METKNAIIRHCCYLDKQFNACPREAEWELFPSTSVCEFTDSCTEHVGELLDDAPQTIVRPILAEAK